jgi:D-proline reductase (dithiol) PrdB
MVRLNDIDDMLRGALEGLECRGYDTKPWVEGPPLKDRRVALVSTAGLQKRGDTAFSIGSDDYRVIPGEADSGDIVMSHVSTNFDRTGFQQDINVAFPIDRLRELADEGVIGSVAAFHYSFMGATDPDQMAPKARELAGLLKKDNVDAMLLAPV